MDELKELAVRWDNVASQLGHETFNDALFQALTTDQIEDLLDYIERMHDLD